MKKNALTAFQIACIFLSIFSNPINVFASTITKANNATDLNVGTSWTGGAAPGSSDIASWTNTVTGANTVSLGADTSWQGISIVGPGGLVTMSAGNTLTLGTSGIDMSAATQNLTINSAVALGGDQTFNVVTSKRLTLSGVISGSSALTRSGAGEIHFTGTEANTYTGTMRLENGGTNGGLWLGKSDNVVAVAGNLTLVNGAGSSKLKMLADNQFGSTSVLSYISEGAVFSSVRFELNGHDQTVAGLDSSGDSVQGWGFIQNGPLGGWGGDPVTSATLTINPASGQSYTYYGWIRDADTGIAGQMSIIKTGAGTQVLKLQSDATEFYSGTTTISAGTLQFATQVSLYNNASASWTAANINVGSGGTLALNVGGVSEFTTGNVTTILTNLGGLGGAVNNNGLQAGSSIAFDTTNASGGAFTVANNIANSTGTGGGAIGVTKLGTGTLTVSGTNTYTGTTAVNAGTLKLGAAGVIADTSALTVSSGATFDLNGNSETVGSLAGEGTVTSGVAGSKTITAGGDNTSTTFSGVAQNGSGTVALTKAGTGTLTLSGANTYTGATTISAGTLAVNNSIQTSSLTTVSSGATIKGSGTTGALAVNGTLSPGNSPGTLSSVGATTYAGGGAYTWEINNAAGTAGTDPGWDLHDITGGLTISATSGNKFGIDITSLTASNVSGDAVNFNRKNNYTWTITDTTTGISGFSSDAFSLDSTNFTNSITGVLQNGYFGIQESGNLLQLLYYAAVDNTNVAQYAANSNARAAGNALDNITNPSSDMTTVLTTLLGLSGSQAGAALDTVYPEINRGLLDNSNAALNNFVGVSLSRAQGVLTMAKATGISSGDESKLNGIWAKGYGSYLDQGTRKGIQGYNAWNAGTAIGLDHLFSDVFTLGVSGGYAYGHVNSAANNGKTNIDSAQGTIYAGYQGADKPYFIDAAGSFAWNWYKGSRDITVGAINRTADADYDGQQYGLYLDGGYKFKLGKTLELAPLASIQWNHLRLAGYTETGADSLNLSVNRQSYNILQSGLGASISSKMKNKWGSFSPELHVKWLYDFINDAMAVTSTYTGGGASFDSKGVRPARNSANIGGKLSLDFKNDISIIGECDTQLSDHFVGVYGSATVRYKF